VAKAVSGCRDGRRFICWGCDRGVAAVAKGAILLADVGIAWWKGRVAASKEHRLQRSPALRKKAGVGRATCVAAPAIC
jgi:hypothetical protein